jgi:hypothetical protein
MFGVLILAVGISGIQLFGGAFFVEPLFNGTTLVVAIALAALRAAPPHRRRPPREDEAPAARLSCPRAGIQLGRERRQGRMRPWRPKRRRSRPGRPERFASQTLGGTTCRNGLLKGLLASARRIAALGASLGARRRRRPISRRRRPISQNVAAPVTKWDGPTSGPKAQGKKLVVYRLDRSAQRRRAGRRRRRGGGRQGARLGLRACSTGRARCPAAPPH